LLNNSNDNQAYDYSPRATPNQIYDHPTGSGYHLHPNYRPPSPMATPKGKRRAPEDVPHHNNSNNSNNKW
jgi:hypothetical protein